MMGVTLKDVFADVEDYLIYSVGVEGKGELVIAKDLFWFFITDNLEKIFRKRYNSLLERGKKDKVEKYAEKVEKLLKKYSDFIIKCSHIANTRPRDFTRYSDDKGRPILNWIKGIVNQAWRELFDENIDQDDISLFLDECRNLYEKEGEFHILILKPNFFYSDRPIRKIISDERSCFRVDGCNEGHGVFLARYCSRSHFVLYAYKETGEGSLSGIGRSWLLEGENSLYVTNFYGTGIELSRKENIYTLVRGFRIWKDWSKAKFISKTSIQELPFYQNGDGLLIWNDSIDEDKAIREIKNIEGTCMECGERYILTLLTGDVNEGNSVCVYQEGASLCNPIVCKECAWQLEEAVECEHCGRRITEDEVRYSPDGIPYCEECFFQFFDYCKICGEVIDTKDAVWVEHEEGYICDTCLSMHFAYCDLCNEYFRSEYVLYVNVIDVYPSGEIHIVRGVPVCERCFDEANKKVYCKWCEEDYVYMFWNSEIPEHIVDEINRAYENRLCIFCYRQKLEEQERCGRVCHESR